MGLDEDMKQVLGLQDTDSDESLDSSSDSESDNHSAVDFDSEEIDGEDAALTGHLDRKRKRPTRSLDSASDSDGIHEESEYSDLEEELDDDDDDKTGPPMSVMAATTDPIYDIPNSPQTLDLRACIICPGKVIKNQKMAKVHLESSVSTLDFLSYCSLGLFSALTCDFWKAHRRRLQRYAAEVSKRTSSREGLNTDDPRDILRDMSGTANYGAQVRPVALTDGVILFLNVCGSQVGTSKRSQRRTQWKDKQAERRRSKKEKRKKVVMDKSKEMEHQKGDAGRAIEKRVKKAKNDGSKNGVSSVSAMVETSPKPQPADGRRKKALASGPAESNLSDNQRTRLKKKRQKRGPP